MLTKTSNLFIAIAERLIKVADACLWMFVAVGVIKIIYNGIDDPCGYALGVCILLASISLFFSVAAFICRLIQKHRG